MPNQAKLLEKKLGSDWTEFRISGFLKISEDDRAKYSEVFNYNNNTNSVGERREIVGGAQTFQELHIQGTLTFLYWSDGLKTT